jgi:hypothetical protein
VARPVYMLPMTRRMIVIMPHTPFSEMKRSDHVIPLIGWPRDGLHRRIYRAGSRL